MSVNSGYCVQVLLTGRREICILLGKSGSQAEQAKKKITKSVKVKEGVRVTEKENSG